MLIAHLYSNCIYIIKYCLYLYRTDWTRGLIYYLIFIVQFVYYKNANYLKDFNQEIKIKR